MCVLCKEAIVQSCKPNNIQKTEDFHKFLLLLLLLVLVVALGFRAMKKKESTEDKMSLFCLYKFYNIK